MISESTIQELLKIKARYLKECKICHGTGIIPEKNDNKNWINATTCDCIKKFKVVKKLYLANISRPYWESTINDILAKQNRKKIRKYIDKIDYCIDNNINLIISGGSSVGKTLMLNIILKELTLNKNIDCHYYSLDTLLDFTKMDQNEIDQYKVVAIDNVGEEYKKEGSDFVVKNLALILKNRLRGNKLTIIASRYNIDRLHGVYNKEIYKILKNNYMSISVKDDIKNVSDIKHKIKNLLK